MAQNVDTGLDETEPVDLVELALPDVSPLPGYGENVSEDDDRSEGVVFSDDDEGDES